MRFVSRRRPATLQITLIHLAPVGLACCLWASVASAQIIATDRGDAGGRLGEAKVQQFRVGAEIEAARGDCRDVLALVAIPLACAEQDVRVLEQDVSPEVRQLSYRDLD